MIAAIVTLSLLLVTSIAVNVLLFYYARKCVEKIVGFHDGVEALQSELQEYTKHCYELSRSEAMFNDPVIVNLYEQTKGISDRCQEFKESFTVVYDEYDDGESDVEEYTDER